MQLPPSVIEQRQEQEQVRLSASRLKTEWAREEKRKDNSSAFTKVAFSQARMLVYSYKSAWNHPNLQLFSII
jgi:hypothetical protein